MTSGRARGVEFYAQKKLTDGLYGQLSYSFSRVEHAGLDAVYRRGGVRRAARPSLGERHLTIWFEAQNVYDRDNVFHYLWDTKANELRSIPQIRAKEQA